MRRVLGVITAALILMVLFHATTANATDRPYTVTVEGVQLTDGTFQANGHINWRTTHGTGSMHFDPNNGQPGGTYIGASFFPIPLAPGECIVWVQVHPFNYHFGEQGEAPLCSTPPTSPTPTPEPEPSSSTPPVSPTPTPTSPPPSPEPSPSSTPSAPPPSTPAEPSPAPSPTPSTGIGTPEFPPTSTPTPTQQAPTPTGTAPTTPPREDLAATGSSDGSPLFGIILAALLIAAGTAIWITRRPRP